MTINTSVAGPGFCDQGGDRGGGGGGGGEGAEILLLLTCKGNHIVSVQKRNVYVLLIKLSNSGENIRILKTIKP